MASALSFQVEHRDADSGARLGRVKTPHGFFETPAFMPVGTRGTVKGLLPEQVRATGAGIILGNTYHLMLRPGTELIHRMGGLQRWGGWNGPILTDSGGYQVFSLTQINRVGDDGVRFKSPLDGAWLDLTPEASIAAQNQIGADIIMAFDDCPPAQALPNQAEPGKVEQRLGTAGRVLLAGDAYQKRLHDACERTARWLDRSVKAHGRPREQALFGIVQGGTDLGQRSRCVEQVTQHDLPGYAIGGVAVGEGYEQLRAVSEHTAPLLPAEKPRYLMGVGYERDIVAAVRAGVDMFDCVLPTRNGRSANAFTRFGQIRLRNARFNEDAAALEADCDCPACRIDPSSGLPTFSRSYLRHLFMAEEMLGPILLSLHNLRHFQRLMLDIRSAILNNGWPWLADRWPVIQPPGGATSPEPDPPHSGSGLEASPARPSESKP